MESEVDFELLEPSEDYLEMCLNGIPFSGVACEKNGDLVVSKAGFLNGKKSGLSQEWYSSGKLMSQQNFFLGSLHGESMEWFPSGERKSQAVFELGICLQKTEYSTDGKVVGDCKLSKSSKQYEILQRLRLSEFAKGAVKIDF